MIYKYFIHYIAKKGNGTFYFSNFFNLNQKLDNNNTLEVLSANIKHTLELDNVVIANFKLISEIEENGETYG